MALTPSTRLGVYEVTAQIGEGGMGQVYRARDTRLNRDVAIKVLRPAVANDPDRLARFEREAQLLASLNHPNIAHVHGLEESGGVCALVMELVEGPTLAETLRVRSALPIGEVLAIGRQVAEALEAAHERGIVHRDLKPANIKVKADGTVKVLDFGLAKAMAGASSAAGLSQSPTILGDTAEGALLGTAPYMSPEQARGQAVDKRTDIFAFGCVLFELLTGHRAFRGDNPSDTIVAILTREPDWSALPSATPAGFRRLLQRCLEKDLKRRVHDIADARIELDDAIASVSAAPRPAIAGGRGARARTIRLGAIAAALLAVSAVTTLGLYWRARSAGDVIDSVAVLPFVNQNHDQETEYLSEGLSESIINNLTQLAGLRVIARNSAFRFKGESTDHLSAGRSLGVRAVVVGRVLQRGQNLTVSAELVDVQDNKQLWGQQYNRTLSDVFAIQEQIAKEISETLRVKLTGTERRQLAKRQTGNIKAFQYYTQGRSYAQRRTREDLLTAVRYCEMAIAEDSNYALAYAGLAEAYSALGTRAYVAPVEGRRKADEAARHALTLDEHLAEAHVAISQVNVLFAPFDLPLVDREVQRAIELSPGFALAHNYLALSYSRQGRFDESLTEWRKARELDPLSPLYARTLAIPYFFKQDYRRALQLLRQARDFGPSFVIPFEIGVYVKNGALDEALAELERAGRERKNDPVLIHSAGLVYAAQGKRAEALQAIRALEDVAKSYGDGESQAQWIAKIESALNDKDAALTWLERGLGSGTIGDFYKAEPVWDPIRRDPRFTALLRRMGVPE